MLPPGFDKVIQAFSNIMAKMTNPFTPLLFANLILDSFSLAIFAMDKQFFVWIPALLAWLFTFIMYAVFAVKAPHMLSATTIQKLGMQIAAGLGRKGAEITEEKLEELPQGSAPRNIGSGNEE